MSILLLDNIIEMDFRHGVIRRGDTLWVAGGGDEFKTESCILGDNKMQCTSVQPTLWLYGWDPEMFLVESNFCRTQ